MWWRCYARQSETARASTSYGNPALESPNTFYAHPTPAFLNPDTLNPETLHPATPNPETPNPETLNPEIFDPKQAAPIGEESGAEP